MMSDVHLEHIAAAVFQAERVAPVLSSIVIPADIQCSLRFPSIVTDRYQPQVIDAASITASVRLQEPGYVLVSETASCFVDSC